MKRMMMMLGLVMMLALGGCGLLDSNDDGSTGGTGKGGDEALVVDR